MPYSVNNIGFYTLTDLRAKNCLNNPPLNRCEMIVTSQCNFKCPYCRGVSNYSRNCEGHINTKLAFDTLNYWILNKLRNVRFSGGEPTFHPNINDFVRTCSDNNVSRIAISTNGSRHWKVYEDLILSGVNDFSVSLDACCADKANKMAGKNVSLNVITENIREMSLWAYTTCGIVFNNETKDDLVEVIKLADDLGVDDIRIISSAQYNELESLDIPQDILDRHPILNYRVNNMLNGINVRGVKRNDCHKCYLALDDIAVAGDYHFPCVIYMREGGEPIGRLSDKMRDERKIWFESHNTYRDKICRINCLDCLIEYNNVAEENNKCVI
jgi:molybdenum cofactor biosynthesis enzyme MoaA